MQTKKKPFRLVIRQLNEFEGCAKQEEISCAFQVFLCMYLVCVRQKIKTVANMYAITNDSLDFFWLLVFIRICF